MKPIEDHKIPDGLYRMEFTAGEIRGPVSYLHAEIIDHPEDGKFAAEYVSRSAAPITWRSSIEAKAIKAKTEIYAEVFGFQLSGLDIEYGDFILRPFFAYIRDGAIAAISVNPEKIHLLPYAGVPEIPSWDTVTRFLRWPNMDDEQKAA